MFKEVAGRVAQLEEGSEGCGEECGKAARVGAQLNAPDGFRGCGRERSKGGPVVLLWSCGKSEYVTCEGGEGEEEKKGCVRSKR